MKKRSLGRFLSADPKVCHGKLCFRGTRILVSDVLELVAAGMSWDKIVKECHDSISRRAIAEAFRLAGLAVVEHADEYVEVTHPSFSFASKSASSFRKSSRARSGSTSGSVLNTAGNPQPSVTAF